MKKVSFSYDSTLPFPSEKIRHWLLQSAYLEKGMFPLTKFGYHTSTVISLDSKRSQIQDRIVCALPFYVSQKKLEKQMKRSISHRNEWIEQDLKRLEKFPLETPLRILMSGSSGLIGTALTRFLQLAGAEVVSLTRQSNQEHSIFWDPKAKVAHLSDFEGFDAVIHLAGESLAEGCWTKSKKRKILESREKGTEFLSSLLKQVTSPPQVFISASGIGYYGSSLDPVNEDSPPGFSFLSKVCIAWESASKSLELFGIRVVQARLGPVLSPEGGMLKALLPLFKLGLGGRVGSGKQKISWIALEDVIGAFYHILRSKDLRGPVNLVSPYVVSQKEFAKTLAKALSKPCFLSFPKLFFPGEKAQELLFSSQEVMPIRLKGSGFTFLYPKLEDALKSFLL